MQIVLIIIIDPFRKLLIYLPNFACFFYIHSFHVFFCFFFFYMWWLWCWNVLFGWNRFTKDTRETSFVSAITAAGITYAITRACTMGDLVECSCDKNHILLYNAQSNDNVYDIDVSARITRFSNNGKHKRRRHNANTNTNSYLRNRNIYRNVILPKGDFRWGGCGDNVMFGFRKSKDFLDSRYQRLSDIRTLVKLHNNNAGRLVSDNPLYFSTFLPSNSEIAQISVFFHVSPFFRFSFFHFHFQRL